MNNFARHYVATDADRRNRYQNPDFKIKKLLRKFQNSKFGFYCPKKVSALFFNKAVRRMADTRQFSLDPIFARCLFGEKLILSVPTQIIQRHTNPWLTLFGKNYCIQDYFLCDAQLDGVAGEISNLFTIREAEELIALGWDYRKAECYQNYRIALKANKLIRRQNVLLDSIEKIDQYFEKFKALHDSIKKHGLVSSNSNSSIKKSILTQRNIGVAIDQNGTLIKLSNGKHRYALAHALNLPFIPVEINMVHCGLLQDTDSCVDPYNKMYRLLDSGFW
ncbi:MAG: hypothetical protein V7750_08135 [Sneathiella sp.]